MGAPAAGGHVQASSSSSSSWTPHGRVLTACLVSLNIFLVLLVYAYFWRFFSRAPPRRADDVEEEEDPEDESSPPGSPNKARDVERAIAALPVFIHSSSSSSDSDTTTTTAPAAAECAICIAEFKDGEAGRVLPRCGHRFHLRCVDTWFRAHATCPLCRDTVLHVAKDEAATTTTAAADRVVGTDSSDYCPV